MDKPKKPKTDADKANDFAREYQILCDKHQHRIVVSPAWSATNHGTFEMVQQYSIGKLPKKE